MPLAPPGSRYIGNDDDVVGTTEELTHVKIATEAVRERPVASGKLSPADAEDSVPPPSLSETIADVAPLRCYCGAIEGIGLAIVDCLDTVVRVQGNGLH